MVQEELREVPLLGMGWRLMGQRMLLNNSTEQMLLALEKGSMGFALTRKCSCGSGVGRLFRGVRALLKPLYLTN